jgi:hypothetical protein
VPRDWKRSGVAGQQRRILIDGQRETLSATASLLGADGRDAQGNSPAGLPVLS